MENRTSRNLGEVIRDEMIVRDEIKASLNDRPKTIPELATDLKYPTNEVLIWVMAMWKYGIIIESGKPDDEGYYQYQLKR